jgi:hypothetical protein
VESNLVAIRMGGQIATSRLAWSACTQSDGIVVGRTLGDSALGTYQMALTLASAPAEKISTLIMRAAGPLFAKIQNDPALVRRYFVIILEGIGLAAFPLMLGLAMMAPEAVQAVLGPKWIAAAAPLAWLALFVTLGTISALCDQVLASLRRTGFTMSMSLLNLVVMPAAFLIASRWGLTPSLRHGCCFHHHGIAACRQTDAGGRNNHSRDAQRDKSGTHSFRRDVSGLGSLPWVAGRRVDAVARADRRGRRNLYSCAGNFLSRTSSAIYPVSALASAFRSRRHR